MMFALRYLLLVLKRNLGRTVKLRSLSHLMLVAEKTIMMSKTYIKISEMNRLLEEIE
jgi:hypothetical protein